ncbi:hypothetical protein JYU34_018402 [Plutella xylostella]|uniref:FP protein C-terminal domain-containing protein n=1 Tax=Plutella xylostella TaxID=51655 RepID=A0ABQ7PXQ9_PLUXY|nr:hypothetical protein JYU34_018402 [Plutella xylostella]
MPINRSPTSSHLNTPPTSAAVSTASLRHCESESDISSLRNNKTMDRKKRKFEGEEDSDIATMMKDMFTAFSKEQDHRFQDLQASIKDLKEENTELVKSIELMTYKYDEFLARITKLEADKKYDAIKIIQLEDKIEFLERKSKSASIEIRNVPKLSSESKDDLCTIVKTLGKTLNVEIQDHEIKDIYRIKTKDSSQTIVTDLCTVLKKEKILRAAKIFNKNKPKGEKLNTGHLQMQGPKKPIYLSESLTFKTQKLFYLARELQKNYAYAFCWTSHGSVYLRRDENSPLLRVSNEADLEGLRKKE